MTVQFVATTAIIQNLKPVQFCASFKIYTFPTVIYKCMCTFKGAKLHAKSFATFEGVLHD